MKPWVPLSWICFLPLETTQPIWTLLTSGTCWPSRTWLLLFASITSMMLFAGTVSLGACEITGLLTSKWAPLR